jgi:hypothetical protein
MAFRQFKLQLFQNAGEGESFRCKPASERALAHAKLVRYFVRVRLSMR